MKNKFSLTVAMVPVISSAHTGHVHNATEIMLSPTIWLDHIEIVTIFGVLIMFMLSKTALKYVLKRKGS